MGDEKTKLLEEARNQKDILVDPDKFKAALHLAITFSSACDFQACELLPEPRVHFWPEMEQHWKSAEKQIAAEEEQMKAQKKANEEKRAQQALEQAIAKAKAQVAAQEEAIAKAEAQVAKQEGKMFAMVSANAVTGNATGDQEPQHEEL